MDVKKETHGGIASHPYGLKNVAVYAGERPRLRFRPRARHRLHFYLWLIDICDNRLIPPQVE